MKQPLSCLSRYQVCGLIRLGAESQARSDVNVYFYSWCTGLFVLNISSNDCEIANRGFHPSPANSKWIFVTFKSISFQMMFSHYFHFPKAASIFKPCKGHTKVHVVLWCGWSREVCNTLPVSKTSPCTREEGSLVYFLEASLVQVLLISFNGDVDASFFLKRT